MDLRPVWDFSESISTADQAIEAVFREEHGRVLAALIRYTGDIQLAEDSLQDACISVLSVIVLTETEPEQRFLHERLAELLEVDE
ncbi:MAG: hypothetical protein M5U23_10870 [Acidimicrobiia bacterium]|nr:hypothetical protein [Acidimicrobiia bacterium]